MGRGKCQGHTWDVLPQAAYPAEHTSSPLALFYGLTPVGLSLLFLNSAKNVANICHVTRNSCVITPCTPHCCVAILNSCV